MAITIHKQCISTEDQLWSPVRLNMPIDSKILHVDLQFAKIMVWYQFDSEKNQTEERFFITYPTGVYLENFPHTFLKTLLVNNGVLVVHVFETSEECHNFLVKKEYV